MFYIKQKYVVEENINKSRFIALLIPVSNKDELAEKLSLIRKDYPKATHYCYAYAINREKGSNDNGEPHGSAGLPILSALNSCNLADCLLVVVRYFGGVKLGLGPLTRAYYSLSSKVIKLASLWVKQKLYKFKLIYNYNLETTIQDTLKQSIITEQNFNDKIETTCLVSDNKLFSNLTSELVISELPSEFILAPYLADKRD